MPVEIKELHIKAIVSGDHIKTDKNPSLKQDEINRLKKEITKEVTEKVLRIIRQKNER